MHDNNNEYESQCLWGFVLRKRRRGDEGGRAQRERERGKRTSGDDGGTQIKLKCPPFTWDAATGVAVVAPILPFAIVVVVPLAVAPF